MAVVLTSAEFLTLLKQKWGWCVAKENDKFLAHSDKRWLSIDPIYCASLNNRMKLQMKVLMRILLVPTLWIVIAQPTFAQEQRFAFRFGLIAIDPTSDATIQGQNTELDTAGGGELNFEWYFKPRWGLDVSAAGAADVETIGEDVKGGISVSPFTIGINYHPIRKPTVDWSVGVLLGNVAYGDFVSEGDDFSITTKDDTAYGIQTSVDLAPRKWKHWAFNLGVKYLKSSAEFKSTPGEVKIDPLIWRAMLVYRW